jgi:molybdenum cofactor guanylyltransferase
MKILAGIFVGGKGSRMGGVAKGLLSAPGGTTTLIDRTAALVSRHVPNAEVVLVGDHPAYGQHPLRAIPDHPPGIGPLGGLIALLEEAKRVNRTALAIACDLPYLSAELIERIATEQPQAAVLAPELDGWRQPLFARYDPGVTLDIARTIEKSGRRSLQAVLTQIGSKLKTFHVEPEHRELLDDWDTQADVDQGRDIRGIRGTCDNGNND